MKPKEFAAKVSSTIGALDGGYRLVAFGKFSNKNFQAQVLLGKEYNGSLEYVLCVADTDPQSDAFSSQHFTPGEVEPLDNGLRFENTNLPPFQNLGSITIPYPS